MLRKLTGKKEPRYAYTVHGDKEALALFKLDAEEGTGGQIDKKTGALIYFSWLPPIAGKTIERNDTKGTWHIDDTAYDEMEYIAKKTPETLRILGDNLMDRLFGKAAPDQLEPEETKEEEEEEFEEQDEDTDGPLF